MFDENDQYELSRYKWVIPFVIILLIATFLLVKCSTDNLQGYADSSSLTSSETDSSKSIDDNVTVITEETYPYVDEDYKFSLEIPTSWSKINASDHNVSFIEKKNGMQLKLTVTPYSPEINQVNENYLTAQANNMNMEIREYTHPTNSNYSVSYASASYGYIDYVYWDYSTIINLVFAIDGKYYNNADLNRTIKYINSSFKWQRANPIPEELQMIYISYGNFEIGLPSDWTYGESSNTILTTNPEGSAACSITVNEASMTLDQISQIDCVNFIALSKPGFMLSSYENTGTMIKVSGSYTLNGTILNVQEYILVNNGYEYILSFDTENQSNIRAGSNHSKRR